MQPRPTWRRSCSRMSFRYIAIEGPIGVGKTSLAERLGAAARRHGVLEERENPFLADFYAGVPARRCRRSSSICSTVTGSRLALRQADLFAQVTICDYLFDKDKIFAYLNLDDNELFIYQRLYDLLAQRHPVTRPGRSTSRRRPTCCAAGCASRAAQREPDTRGIGARRRLPARAERGLPALLLSLLRHAAPGRRDLADRPAASDEALDDLIRQIRTMGKGTRYYVPRP